jgi:hypothetical protein
MNNNYCSKTVVKQVLALYVDGRAAHVTDTTLHLSQQSTPLPDHAGSIPMNAPHISTLARTMPMASAFSWQIMVTPKSWEKPRSQPSTCLYSVMSFTLCLGRHSGCFHVLSRTSQIYACFEKKFEYAPQKPFYFVPHIFFNICN